MYVRFAQVFASRLQLDPSQSCRATIWPDLVARPVTQGTQMLTFSRTRLNCRRARRLLLQIRKFLSLLVVRFACVEGCGKILPMYFAWVPPCSAAAAPRAQSRSRNPKSISFIVPYFRATEHRAHPTATACHSLLVSGCHSGMRPAERRGTGFLLELINFCPRKKNHQKQSAPQLPR